MNALFRVMSVPKKIAQIWVQNGLSLKQQLSMHLFQMLKKSSSKGIRELGF